MKTHGTNVIIVRDDAPKERKGFALAESTRTRERPYRGTVCSVGSAVTVCRVGDRVTYKAFAGQPYQREEGRAELMRLDETDLIETLDPLPAAHVIAAA